MTSIFLDTNDKIYITECLTYNIAKNSYKNDTDKSETWEKTTFSGPPESAIFAFIESLSRNPPTKQYRKHVLNILNNWHFTEWTR